MPFILDDFMLTSDAARELYFDSAEKMPIIDYHCHLSPKEIAENKSFLDLTEIWLGGDHYKWRAMRGNGIPERYITGDAPSYEKFQKWAETVPYTMRNPLYHWTHLELSRVFGIDSVLKPETARDIYEECTAKLQTPAFSTQSIIRRFNVETLCTTDDPVDDLRYHKQIAEHPFGAKVLPTWRPDKLNAIESPLAFKAYVESLGKASGKSIGSYDELLDAVQNRHDYFESMGCRLSDHGLETFYSEEYTQAEIDQLFKDAMAGKACNAEQATKWRSAILHDLAVMDAKSGWAQQYHIGPLRNCNERMYRAIGPDTGFDAVGDRPCAAAGHRFFSRLDDEGHLAKTILYCINSKDFEVMATMAYTFNDGSCPGKMQLGSGWWFLDQEYGMRKQLDTLSSLGLLSRFVGMLTDSRSMLSYPRHEYFRRILCDVIGRDVEDGKLPWSEMPFIHEMVKDISYCNAKNYFRF